MWVCVSFVQIVCEARYTYTDNKEWEIQSGDLYCLGGTRAAAGADELWRLSGSDCLLQEGLSRLD